LPVVRVAIRYHPAPDLDRRIREIAAAVGLPQVNERVRCIRSRGGRARWTLARCHNLSRAVAAALGIKPHYVIEVIAERFDKLSDDEKSRTLIHEILHIPKSLGGGFRSHRFVRKDRVERLFKELKRAESTGRG